ncbi:MAG: hypothetical protein AABX30_02785 [Nanoarchaeota archaeon]
MEKQQEDYIESLRKYSETGDISCVSEPASAERPEKSRLNRILKLGLIAGLTLAGITAFCNYEREQRQLMNKIDTMIYASQNNIPIEFSQNYQEKRGN